MQEHAGNACRAHPDIDIDISMQGMHVRRTRSFVVVRMHRSHRGMHGMCQACLWNTMEYVSLEPTIWSKPGLRFK